MVVGEGGCDAAAVDCFRQAVEVVVGVVDDVMAQPGWNGLCHRLQAVGSRTRAGGDVGGIGNEQDAVHSQTILAHGDLQRMLAGRGQIYGCVTATLRDFAPAPFIREAGQVSGGGWCVSIQTPCC